MNIDKTSYISPNFGERAGGQSPSMLVLHYTGMANAEDALARLCDQKSEVSAHYVVDKAGTIYQLVDDDKRAHHAGISYWCGERDVNSASIGIEIVNGGHDHGYTPFPEAQIKSVEALCKHLVTKYNIASRNIIGHSDIAYNRNEPKIDPGHLFPWKRLAQNGIGAWPDTTSIDKAQAQSLAQDKTAFHKALCDYGYDPSAPFEETLIAFHRHFAPEKFQDWSARPCTPENDSVATLLALLAQ